MGGLVIDKAQGTRHTARRQVHQQLDSGNEKYQEAACSQAALRILVWADRCRRGTDCVCLRAPERTERDCIVMLKACGIEWGRLL